MTEVTPGAATYDKPISSVKHCLCLTEREGCKINTQAKFIKLYFQGRYFNFFQVFLVLTLHVYLLQCKCIIMQPLLFTVDSI